MSAKITYNLEFQGLNEQIVKLRELDSLLNSIGKKGGNIGNNGGNINTRGGTSSGGGTVILPSGAKGVAAGEGIAAGAQLAAAGSALKASKSFGKVEKANTEYFAKMGELIKGNLVDVRGMTKDAVGKMVVGSIKHAESVQAKLQVNTDLLEEWGYLVDKKIDDITKVMEYSLTSIKTDKTLSKSEGYTILKKASDETHKARTKAQLDLINKPGNVYDTQLQSSVDKFGNSKPYSGKISPKLENPHLKDIKSMASVFGLGKLTGTLGKLGVVAGLVFVAFEGLKIAIKKSQEGIEYGSKTYRGAAGAGMGVGAHGQISSAFGQLGMNTPDLTVLRTMLTGNTKQDTNTILNAGQMGMLGRDGQQLVNMAEEFREAMKGAAASAELMKETATANNKLKIDEYGIMLQWKTMWSQVSAIFEPLMHHIFNIIALIEMGFNKILNWILKIEHYLHIGSKPTEDFKPVWGASGGGSMISPNSSLEKLGFVMNSPAQEMAHDIEEIARNTGKMVSFMGGGSWGDPSFRGKGAGGSWGDPSFRGKGAGGSWALQSFPSHP
jgi:hypothetical protein